MSGNDPLSLGAGLVRFTRALLILGLAYGMTGGMTAARRAAPAAKPIRRALRNTARFLPGSAPRLDRIAAAIEVAESSDGTNPRMMHADLAGPQGPMQISAVAAAAIGGGNRFNRRENLVLGRAYLASMHRRYGNWADAIAAYNWGPGHMDVWLHQGRHTDRLPAEVARYTGQVLLAATRPAGRRPAPDAKASSLARHRSVPSPRMRRMSEHKNIARADRALIPAGARRTRMIPPARRTYSRKRREYKKDAFIRLQDSSLRKRRTLHYRDRVADNERPLFILAHAPGHGLRRSRNAATLQSRSGRRR